jgi:L-ascorbate metabolism protein UlaG (beta-lactamase superfamily)
VRITWIGHATVLIETAEGTRLLTDPVLRARIGHVARRAPPAVDPGRVHAILLSHLHHDHLDLPSLRGVHAPVLGPPGSAHALRRLGVRVNEVMAGDEHVVDGVRIRAVHAEHDGRRWPHQRRRDDDALGFTVEDGERRVYFAGDTELFDGMRDLGALDAALVPIWGWGPSLGAGHLDPEEAAQALALLRPAVAVPIHWGTYLRYGLERRLLRDPLDAFVRAAAETAPGVDVRVLEPGATLEL